MSSSQEINTHILPSNWEETEIGSLCNLINGRAFKKTEWSETGLPIIRIQNLNNSDAQHNYFCGELDPKHKIVEGNLLFAWSGTPGTSFGAHEWKGPAGALNQHIYKIEFDEHLINKVFFRYSINQKLNELIGGAQGAVGLKHVTKGKFTATRVAFPPLNEQARIANKLDSLLAKVDAAQARLDKIPTLLKRFRQSVLAAATSGELTREWCEDNPQPPWTKTKLGQLVDKIEAGKNIKCDERPPENSEFGIIKISAVTWGFYDESQSKTLLDNNLFIEARRVQVGDFLISRANTLELLGMPVIVEATSKNLMLSDKVLRLVMSEGNKKWINYFLRSPVGRKEIESRATGNQQSMRNIGQKALLDIDLVSPSNEEKQEIIRRVESLFTLADTVEKQYQDAKQRIDRLTQSILAKAFRGELVPQDPNDEPASELLKRIAVERESQKPVKKTRKKKTKATEQAELPI